MVYAVTDQMRSLSWCCSTRMDLYDDLCLQLSDMVFTIGNCFVLDAVLEPFGSSATGLYEAESDLDILLQLKTRDNIPPEPDMIKAITCALLRQLECHGGRRRITNVVLQVYKDTLRFDFESSSRDYVLQVDLNVQMLRALEIPKHVVMRNFVINVLQQQGYDANAAAIIIKRLIQILRLRGYVQNSPQRGTKLKSVIVVVLVCGALLLQQSLHEVADTMVEYILVVQVDSFEVTWQRKTQRQGLVEVAWSSGERMTANAIVHVRVVQDAVDLVCSASAALRWLSPVIGQLLQFTMLSTTTSNHRGQQIELDSCCGETYVTNVNGNHEIHTCACSNCMLRVETKRRWRSLYTCSSCQAQLFIPVRAPWNYGTADQRPFDFGWDKKGTRCARCA